MESESAQLLDQRSLTKRRVKIDREIFSQDRIDDNEYKPEPIPLSSQIKGYFSGLGKNIFPPIDWVPNYKKEYVLGDVISGLTVAMIRLPQGLAYGLLAGLAPINGVYLEFFLCIMYSILSTVPQNSTGTFSIIALMTGAAVDKQFPSVIPANGSSTDMAAYESELMSEKVKFASALALVVGIIQVLFGLLNLGAVSILLAKPVVAGFTTASAIIVTLAQATHLFGVPVTRFSGFASPLKTIGSIFQGISGGVNMPACVISLVSIPFLYSCKLAAIKYKEKLRGYPIPAELFLVIVTTTVCYYLPEDNDVIVVGEVPSGLPTPGVPPVGKYVSDFMSDAISIAVIGYSTNLSLAKIFSSRHGFTWSANQEGFALGIAHIFASFFTCFPGSAALARSSLQESAGGKSQFSSVVSASMMLMIILWIGPVFETLPRSVLSCIVVVNLRSMFLQFKQLPVLWKTSRKDFVIWLSAFFGVILLGVDLGLITGILFLLLSLVRDQTKSAAINIDSFEKSELYVRVNQSEIMKKPIIRFTGPLNFASADALTIPVDTAIIDMSRVVSYDFVGLTKLAAAMKKLDKIAVVGCQPDLRRALDNHEDLLDVQISFYASLIDADCASDS